MKHHFHVSLKSIAIVALLGLTLSACALGRSEIDVKSPASMAAEGTTAVKITEVRDSRVFTAAPKDPSEPSLEKAAELDDPKITARAVGRKRGGFGAVLGDVVLPEGITVVGLVRDAAQAALQDKGYKVVDQSSPDYSSALPLALDIDKFWAWVSPGFTSVDVSFKSRIVMTGDPLVGAEPVSAEGFANYSSGVGIFESDWTALIQKGLEDLAVKMKSRIKTPSEIGR